MKPPRKPPPKPRNVAAKALRSPLFRPKIVEPKVAKRRKAPPTIEDDEGSLN